MDGERLGDALPDRCWRLFGIPTVKRIMSRVHNTRPLEASWADGEVCGLCPEGTAERPGVAYVEMLVWLRACQLTEGVRFGLM
jgi:hypothetical protein